MDFQNRVGSKPGSGGVAGSSESNVDRRERLRKLALETIDISKDPYILKNHLGSYECKLCLTLHTNEGSYLAHTQGKKHQANLARRHAREARIGAAAQGPTPAQLAAQPVADALGVPKKQFIKIGRPGYEVLKVRDPETKQHGFLFRIAYPEIAKGEKPRHRFMGAFEQRIEVPDRNWQYVVVAAEPYETVAFKVPAREIDLSEGKFFTFWDPETKQYALQLLYRSAYGSR
ncbi:CWF complex protein sap62 [Blastocladiella emersonii ATCC 22665]|nr:CWF complex protein sap62 [Blastocladiella emersonii ATCC 22665]